MSKTIGSLSVCGAAMFLSLLVSSAFGYEKEIEQLSAQMAEKIAGKGKKTVAVVDFTDLQGNVTELGRFLAEELSGSLSKGERGFEVVNRSNLKQLIQEHKLFSTGVIDQKAAMKLGEFSGIEALITGTITPFTENIRVSTSVLDMKTAKVIDNEKENIPRTKDINELLGKEINSENVSSLTERAKMADSQVVEGILFEAKGCKLSGGSLTCRLLVTSQDEDKEISVFNDHDWSARTRVFDNMSNEYRASMLEIANKKSRSSSAGHTLVSGVATKLAFTFEGIKESMESLSLLEVAFSNNLASISKAQLRNIPVSR